MAYVDGPSRLETRPKLTPRWFVSAPHKVRQGPEGAWSPYGLRHARQVGQARTECGLVALDWPMFWELPFLVGDRSRPVCEMCHDMVVRATR